MRYLGKKKKKFVKRIVKKESSAEDAKAKLLKHQQDRETEKM